MTERIIKSLFLKILVFQLVFLGLSVVFSVVLTAHFKYRLGSQLAAAFRNDLLMGDTRKAMLELPGTVRGDFAGVKWVPSGSSQAFSIPENIDFTASMVYGRSVVSIYFDEKRTRKCGDLVFYYYHWIPIVWALIVWSLLFICSIPVWFRERRKIVQEYALSLKAEINESRANLAAQVAHDIRSPLVALDAALKNTSQLPEKQRVIVRHAVNRIRDIANNLLEKNRQQAGTAMAAATAAGEAPAVHLLSSLIDPVITEKRLSFESRHGINIDFKLTWESYGLFARIQPVEFRRMLSNLVNNAVEALGDKGAVDVNLNYKNESIVLTVSDNGKGIPPAILAKLGQRGETHGKAGGSGLGLFHARSAAESWGGSLAITSELGKGTTITIKLPRAEAPAGFVPVLILTPGRPVVVLDDDTTIHQIWQDRFDSARVNEHDIKTFHFSEPDKLRDWVKADPVKAKSAVCLFDYKLLGFKETGLSLAEELGLCGKTILVTSRYEEKCIIDECSRLKIRTIPKGLADFIPIQIEADKKQNTPSVPASPGSLVVLIDDDTLVRMNWEMAAETVGIELKAFKDPAEFLSNPEAFPKDTAIYIDSELGENIKGENIAVDLREKGFTNICLATGHPPERFSHLPWLKVIGKEPPWN